MHVSNTINCNGLSTAPTVLRIKQALTGLSDDNLPLGVLVDSECDCTRVVSSLGPLAGDVCLASDLGQLPMNVSASEVRKEQSAEALRRVS